MSVYGMLTVGSLLVALYQKMRHREVSEGFLAYLLVLLMAQLFFVFINGFCLACAFSGEHSGSYVAFFIAVGFVVVLYVIRWRIIGTTAGRVLLVLFLLGNLAYTEYFNGSATFDTYADFRVYQAPLKHYYWLTPPNVTADPDSREGGQVEVYTFPQILTFTGTVKVKQQDGKLYYYFIEGFGHPGRWFEYGVPRGQQVL